MVSRVSISLENSDRERKRREERGQKREGRTREGREGGKKRVRGVVFPYYYHGSSQILGLLIKNFLPSPRSGCKWVGEGVGSPACDEDCMVHNVSHRQRQTFDADGSL